MTYTPKPVSTEGVELSNELLMLSELLATNVHEVWSTARIAEGWQYGPEHDYKQKHHPCLVPYDRLPESEKEYDRKTAMETLKLIQIFGFNMTKNLLKTK
jgi:RyR domain.